MQKKEKKNPILENILITDAAAEGKSIARYEGRVIFVAQAIPGDLVDLEIIKKKSGFWEGKIIKIIQKSEDRVEPFCSHFGLCGGCKWQHLSYNKQLFYKQQQIQDHFERIGKLSFPDFLPIIGAEKTQYYRNKLDYTFSTNGWLTQEQIASEENFDRRALGFHIAGHFDKVLNLEHCYLQSLLSNEIRNAVLYFAKQENIPFYQVKNHEGILRNLIIRSTENQMMVILAFSAKKEEDFLQVRRVLTFLTEKFPQITSLFYVNNLKKNDDLSDQNFELFFGEKFLTAEMFIKDQNIVKKKLKFKISPKSFYQTNSEQAQKLYQIVRDFAQIQNDEIVYDLYTGTGTIAQFVADQAKKVIGIDYVESAILDAKANAKNNQIENVDFFAGDMKKVLTEEFIAEHGKPQVILADPARAGMDVAVVDQILNIKPERLVYVSCNSATQARDLALMQADYQILKVQAVDLFPHTHHVENVVLLVKKS